jgi:hypothetical protein
VIIYFWFRFPQLVWVRSIWVRFPHVITSTACIQPPSALNHWRDACNDGFGAYVTTSVTSVLVVTSLRCCHMEVTHFLWWKAKENRDTCSLHTALCSNRNVSLWELRSPIVVKCLLNLPLYSSCSSLNAFDGWGQAADLTKWGNRTQISCSHHGHRLKPLVAGCKLLSLLRKGNELKFSHFFAGMVSVY